MSAWVLAVNREYGNFLMIIGLLGKTDFKRMLINLNSDELAGRGSSTRDNCSPKTVSVDLRYVDFNIFRTTQHVGKVQQVLHLVHVSGSLTMTSHSTARSLGHRVDAVVALFWPGCAQGRS